MNKSEHPVSVETEQKPKKKNKLFERIGQTVSLVKGNFKSLVSFELAYRVLCLVVFFPILVYLERMLLYVNGTDNLAQYNVGKSLVNPLTWLILIVVFMAVVFFTMLEQGGLAIAIHASKDGTKLNVKEILAEGTRYAIDKINAANWPLLPYVLLVLPLTALTDETSIVRFIEVPGFIMEFIYQRQWATTLWYAANVIILILSIGWIFTFTVMAIERTGFSDAAKKSWKAVKTTGVLRLLATLLCYYILFAAVVSLTVFLVFAVWFLIWMWIEPGAASLDLLMTAENVEMIVMIVKTVYMWVGAVIFQTVIQEMYYRACEKEGREVPSYEPNPAHIDNPFLKAAFWTVCALAVFFSVPPRVRQVKWMLNTDNGKTMIMAHRGYSEAAPENTIPAFQAAVDAGVKSVELDVQMLKDGTIIVMHDDNFERTCGVKKNVWEVTYDEVKTYDAGSFFSEEFAGTQVPTLDQVIKEFRNDLFINIEIKRNGHDEGIEKAVVDIIRENDFIDHCDVTSQDYETLVLVKEANPDVLTAYTTVIGLGEIDKLDAASIISIQETFATFANVERLHRAGKRVFVWTVNDEDVMERLVSLNVDAILTNDPVKGVKVLENHKGALDLPRRISQILRYV